MSARTATELWELLAAAGLTAGEMPAADDKHTPWYVRVMLGIAGLIAALFLLGFVGVGFAFVVESKTASIAVGLMVITAAYAIFRAGPRSEFGSMFALSVSIAGQALVIFGLFGMFDGAFRTGVPWATVALFEAALAVMMPNFIHRVMSSFGAGYAFSFACAVWGIQPVVPGIFAAAVAYLWLNELRLGKYHSAVAPIGYGLTLLFVQIEATSRFGHTMAMMLGSRAAATDWPWFGETLAAAALFVSVWVMVRRAGWALAEKRAVLALAAAAAIGAVSLQAPGVAAGLMITLLGFANANRVLTALGIMALLGYVSTYYYLLDATLLVKSGVLLATGLVLLAVRWMVLNVVMPREGQDA